MKQVSELITDIQNITSMPLGDEDRWNSATLVGEMNNVMLEKVVPDILRFGSEYFVFRKVIELGTDDIIPIPARAYGRIIREVKYLAANDERNNEQNVPQLTLPNADADTRPFAVFMQNDAIVLHRHADSQTGSLVLYYFLKPSTLVNETLQFAPISNISSNTVTTSSTGSALNTYCSVGQTKLFDVLRKTTGAIIEHDVVITRSATNTYTTTSPLGSTVSSYQSGGFPLVSPYSEELYLVPAGQCQFSTLSDDFDKLLVYHTASKIFESQGDFDSLQINAGRIKEINDHYARIFGNRIAGEPTKVVDRQNIGRSIRRQNYGIWGTRR